jgi:hypothetical protein
MNAMQQCGDDEFDWIRTGSAKSLSGDDPNWEFVVSNLIPNQFEAYAKILHQVDGYHENIDHPLTEREIAILKIPRCTKLKSYVENLRKEGDHSAQELADVLSDLRPFTDSQTLKEADWDFVFRGAPDDLAAFLRGNKYQFTPKYWWPANRNWCLCSEYDLKFSLLAGSKDLISAVLNSATLEALQVTPQTRIDDAAPLPR